MNVKRLLNGFKQLNKKNYVRLNTLVFFLKIWEKYVDIYKPILLTFHTLQKKLKCILFTYKKCKNSCVELEAFN